MNLEQKIEASKRLIEQSLTIFQVNNPVIYWSSGKDSMVMLHLLREMGYNYPILFHKDPHFPKKFSFANEVIDKWNLTVYDYPPRNVAVVENNGTMEIIGLYPVRDNGVIWLPIGIKKISGDFARMSNFEEGQYLCGLKDLMCRPLGVFSYPWNVAFIGHKSVDKDLICNLGPLKNYIHKPTPSMLIVFPLRDWTDEDVWDYIRSYNVPWNKQRYKSSYYGNACNEYEDTTFNNDYYESCIACLEEKNLNNKVYCPKHKCDVISMAGIVPRIVPAQFDYVEKKV